MILFDKMKQRGLERAGKPMNSYQTTQPQSPLPAMNLNNPAVAPAVAPSTMPVADRLAAIPQRGAMGSMPQWQKTPNRFIADLPANVQLQGIQSILSGQETNSPIVNNFVKGMAAQGKTPEEIRLAFLEHQKNSADPLVLM